MQIPTGKCNYSSLCNSSLNNRLRFRLLAFPNQYFHEQLIHKTINELLINELSYDNNFYIKSEHINSINSLAIDNTENRFLLSGGADATLSIYDTLSSLDNLNNNSQLEPLTTIRKGQNNNHKYSITSVCWYPIDTGMFITASSDKTVKVWDSSTLETVYSFNFFDRVNSITMSSNGMNHSIVACALKNGNVHLCDLQSGSSAQQLLGHVGSVQSIQFSPTNEFLIATASDDQSIRLWDIRKAGYLFCLDMYSTFRNISKQNIQSKKFSTKKIYASSKVPIAHHQSIKSILFSFDGHYLYSSGNDNELRKWNIYTCQNTLIHFPDIINTHTKSCQLLQHIYLNDEIIFHASNNKIQMFNGKNGSLIKELNNNIHYGNINTLCYQRNYYQLFSGGDDNNIIVWNVEKLRKPLMEENLDLMKLQDKDDWSD
ncbi:hypothetical protein ABK040_014075 [Willaertia magna]